MSAHSARLRAAAHDANVVVVVCGFGHKVKFVGHRVTEDYSVTAITPIKGIHANVMPLYTNWSATDENDRFILTTVDLTSQLLKLVARGQSLTPGSTNATLNTLSSTNALIIAEQQWLH